MRACVILAVATFAPAQPPLGPGSGPGGPLELHPVPPPPPPPPASPFEDAPSPLFQASRGSWYATSDLAILFPKLAPGGTPALRVPTANFGTSYATMTEVGHRLGDGQGQLVGGYRLLNAEGSQGGVETRLSVNSFQLDWGPDPVEIVPRYTLDWRIGARADQVYFDTRQALPGGQVYQASNNFFGGGIHGRADLERRIVLIPGLSLFGRLDASVLSGNVQQRYRNEAAGVTITARTTRLVPNVQAQAGLSFAPQGIPGLKITGGWMIEEYWKVGTLGVNLNGSVVTKGDAWWHGPFLRAQYDF